MQPSPASTQALNKSRRTVAHVDTRRGKVAVVRRWKNRQTDTSMSPVRTVRDVFTALKLPL